MLHVSAAGWAATLVALAALFGFDLLRSARRPHAVGFREAVVWSVLYIAVALLFGVVFGLVAGWDLGAQYYAGYIVEKSLSVDNLFVFLIIMNTFSVPAEQQARALTIGIVAALVMRAIFIAAGAALLTRSRSCSWSSAWCSPRRRSSCFATATRTRRWTTTCSYRQRGACCQSPLSTTVPRSSPACRAGVFSRRCSWC